MSNFKNLNIAGKNAPADPYKAILLHLATGKIIDPADGGWKLPANIPDAKRISYVEDADIPGRHYVAADNPIWDGPAWPDGKVQIYYYEGDALNSVLGREIEIEGDLIVTVPLNVTAVIGEIPVGVKVSTTFDAIRMSKGEHFVVTKKIIDRSTGLPKNCAGYTSQFGVKANLGDSTYKIGPVAGVLAEDENGVLSIFSWTIPTLTTKSMAPFFGKYEVVLFDALGEKTTMTPSGGQSYRLLEDVIDVP